MIGCKKKCMLLLITGRKVCYAYGYIRKEVFVVVGYCNTVQGKIN